MQPLAEPTRPLIFGADHQLVFHSLLDGGARAFGDFEVYELLCLALQDGGVLLDLARCHETNDCHLYQIVAAELAVDRHVEEREIAMVLAQLKPDANWPDVLLFQQTLLARYTALVPSRA